MDKQKNKLSFVDILFLIILPILVIFGILFSNLYSCSNKINDNSDSVSLSENVDVQRSIKKANNSANPINPNTPYEVIFLNNTLTAQEMYGDLIYLVIEYSSAFIPLGNGMYAYPVYAYQEYGDTNISVIFVMYLYDTDTLNRSFTIVKGYLDMTVLGVYGALYEYRIEGNYTYSYNLPIANYITPSNDFKTINPLSSVSFGGATIPIGSLNPYITSIFSSVPYDFICAPSVPTYENAPQSLVDNPPFNTEYPSGVNNKSVIPIPYYPSVSGKYYGSLLGNPLSITGAQGQTYYDYKADLYINSSLRPKQEVFGFDDFISYYNSYDYIFTGFDIVIQSMWGRIPIYYKITTNDFGFVYDVSRLLNESNTIEDYFNLALTSDVEERFSDYVHINIQFFFNADTNYDSKYFNVNEEYELEALIPNTYYNNEYIQAQFSSLRYDADSFITNDEVVANGAYQTLRNYRIATSNVLNRLEQAYSDEYEQGFNEGYSAGVIDAGGDNALGPVFAWLSSASSIIANIFSIQIFPYITLGMLLLFPLVVFVLVWILKLFFGG